MILEIFWTVLIIFSAIVLHEYAHGWMANQCGDPTAKLAGRLTLNPLKHIDPVGTVILPGILFTLNIMGFPTILFGWAKPVPVNFMGLNNPKRDMIYVGMAGPAINIISAIIISLIIRAGVSVEVYKVLEIGIFINLLLAIFNMIPIPPLDGSRLVMGLLPNKHMIAYARLERYGVLIVILLLSFTEFFGKVILPAIFFCGKLLGISFTGI